MAFKVIIMVIDLMFLGINMFLAQLRINSIVILLWHGQSRTRDQVHDMSTSKIETRKNAKKFLKLDKVRKVL